MTPDGYAEVDIDLLADYIGGALDGPDEAAVARLVADDPRWRETYDLLAPGMIEVGAGLQTLGAQPEPMPADVVARLDAALAAAPTAAPTAEPAGITDQTTIAEPSVIDPALAAPAEPHLAPVRDGQRHLHVVPGSGSDRAPRRRSRRLRWAAPIAAAAGVLAFAGLGIDYLISTSDSATQVAGSGSNADQAAPMMESQSLVTPPAADAIVTSGTDYTGTTLGNESGGVMAAPESPLRSDRNSPAAAGEFGTDPLARLRVREALTACLEAIAQERGGTPIAVQRVDYARFEGAPAVIVRFTADGATWAWAAGPDCGASGRGASPLQTRQVG